MHMLTYLPFIPVAEIDAGSEMLEMSNWRLVKGNPRNHIIPIHHAMIPRPQGILHTLAELSIPNSRLPISQHSINSVHDALLIMQLQDRRKQDRECAAQAMPCYHDLSMRVLCQQILQCLSDGVVCKGLALFAVDVVLWKSFAAIFLILEAEGSHEA